MPITQLSTLGINHSIGRTHSLRVGCSALGLFGLLVGDVEMFLYLLLGLSPVVMKGSDFGRLGGNDDHEGVLHKFGKSCGAYPPPTCGQNGGSR